MQKPAYTEKTNPLPPRQSSDTSPLRILAPFLIVAVVGIVFGSILSFDFLYLDDVAILRGRYFLIGNLSNLPLAFTTDAFLSTSVKFYRPLQTLSFMLEAAIGGKGPFIFHLASVLLHAGTCLILYWFLLTLDYRRTYAFAAALLYAVHPVFVSTVAWIPSRGDQLLTMFVLISVILFLRSTRSSHRVWPFLHGIAFLLAFLAKETAIIVPLICLALFFLDSSRKSPPGILWKFAGIWSVVTGIWLLLRLRLASAPMPDDVFGLQPLLANWRMIPEMLGKFFLPVDLKLIPQFNAFDTFAGLAVIALLLVVIIRSRGHMSNLMLFGLLWFLLFSAPVLAFRNPEAPFFFDYLYHRSYLTDIGLVLVVLEFLRMSGTANRSPRIVGIAAGAVFLFLAAMSLSEVRYYSDPKTFYTEAIERSPRSALCYNNRGVYLFNNMIDPNAAYADFNTALSIFPAYAQAMSNRGMFYLYRQKVPLAEQDLDEAVRIKPHDPDILFKRGHFRLLRDDVAGALRDYDGVLSRNRLYPGIWSARAECLARLGRFDEAIRAADRAIALDPRDAQAWYSRALARFRKQDYQEAITDCRSATSYKLRYPKAFNLLGRCHAAVKDFPSAEQAFSRAIQLDPSDPASWKGRGLARFKLEDRTGACSDWREALALGSAEAADLLAEYCN